MCSSSFKEDPKNTVMNYKSHSFKSITKMPTIFLTKSTAS
jgi:hypothetical protein